MSEKRIAVISNDHVWTYNLRRELLKAMIDHGYHVTVIVGYGKKVDDLRAMGCDFVDIPVERHGMNVFHELLLIKRYKKALQELKPDAVLTYTIKPNIYGGLVCGQLKIPFIANITGLGTAVEYKNPMQKLITRMLKQSLKNASMVFFQNTENRDFLVNRNIVTGRYGLLPGSGVNVEYFSPLPYPDDGVVRFVFISRIMREKGIEQYLDAAVAIREKYPDTQFHICGFCEQAYEKRISELSSQGIVVYHGMVDDIREIHKISHCTIHPTYYPEGMSNVLLESAACARPIISTDRSGCREVIDDGINGYIIKQQNSQDLIEKIEHFLSLSWEKRRDMGLAGRAKVVNEFDRQIIIEKYMAELTD